MEHILPKEITFEIHITTNFFNDYEEERFLSFCKRQDYKPILIELSKGYTMKQPMISKIIKTNNMVELYSTLLEIQGKFKEYSFDVDRVKVEIPASNWEIFSEFEGDKYFEWHGKVNYKNIEPLLKGVIEDFDVEIATNAYTSTPDSCLITLRKNDEKIFNGELQYIKDYLYICDIEIIKEESEYCIYDSNIKLDDGWLNNLN